MLAFIVAYLGQDTRMYVTKEREKVPSLDNEYNVFMQVLLLGSKFEFCSFGVRPEYKI